MSDFISREAAINELNAEGYTKNMRIHKRILAIPAADVAPVGHGHFGKHTSPFTAPCSECGTSMNTYWHYCPNCGAKMDGGQDDV